MSGSYVDVYFRDLSNDKLFYYTTYYCQCRTIHGFSRWISRVRALIMKDNISVSKLLPENYDFHHVFFSTIEGVFESVNDKPIVFRPDLKINPSDYKIYEV